MDEWEGNVKLSRRVVGVGGGVRILGVEGGGESGKGLIKTAVQRLMTAQV